MKKIQVLDKGYVRLVNVMGDELSIVNAARVSYDKESKELDEKDLKLLKFLLREKHLSPLRHVSMTFEVYSPLMVARQHWKYSVASTFVDDQNGWNESSRRYVTEKEEFYVPSSIEWRTAPENSKQGSGDPLSPEIGRELTKFLEIYLDSGDAMYKYALKNNVAPEQARLFLPAYSMYIRYRWTVSLASIIHFLEERLKDDAQYEIRSYANAIYSLLQPLFPNVFKEIFKIDLEEPAVNKITFPVFERAAKNESKSEYLNRMNRKIDAIVESVRELHESNSGIWELKYNPDPINFDYGDMERKYNDV